MKLSEIRELVHVGAPEAPYGVRALARCYDIDDLARLARKRLPAGVRHAIDILGEELRMSWPCAGLLGCQISTATCCASAGPPQGGPS